MGARLVWVIFLKGGEIFVCSVETRTSVQTTRPPSRRLPVFLPGNEAAVLLSCVCFRRSAWLDCYSSIYISSWAAASLSIGISQISFFSVGPKSHNRVNSQCRRCSGLKRTLYSFNSWNREQCFTLWVQTECDKLETVLLLMLFSLHILRAELHPRMAARYFYRHGYAWRISTDNLLEDRCFLGYDTVYRCNWSPAFRRHLPLTSVSQKTAVLVIIAKGTHSFRQFT